MPYTAPGVIFAVASSLLFYYGGDKALFAYGPTWYDGMALWLIDCMGNVLKKMLPARFSPCFCFPGEENVISGSFGVPQSFKSKEKVLKAREKKCNGLFRLQTHS